MTDLTEKKCVPCEGGVQPLSKEKAEELIQKLDGWKVGENNKSITKDFSFKNFYKTMAFVNAVAWIANQDMHHPDMKIGYDYCKLELMTHAISGLSENDFIVAAKIDNFCKSS